MKHAKRQRFGRVLSCVAGWILEWKDIPVKVDVGKFLDKRLVRRFEGS
jgi:hypothetical protein